MLREVEDSSESGPDAEERTRIITSMLETLQGQGQQLESKGDGEAVQPGEASQKAAIEEQAAQMASKRRKGSCGNAITGFLDSGASHNQLSRAALRKLGQGAPLNVKTKIIGVNEGAPLTATEVCKARWPPSQERDGITHALRLDQVLSGEEVKGDALISVGRLTA